MPTRFMRFLIISSSLPPIALCSTLHLNCVSLSHTLGCFPHLSWPFQRKRQRQKKKLLRDTETLTLSTTRYSSTFCSCTLNAHHPFESASVCVCVISISWESVWSGWPGGWWSVALPSCLCCQPHGDHTNTHTYGDTITHTLALKHTWMRARRRSWDCQCLRLVSVSLPCESVWVFISSISPSASMCFILTAWNLRKATRQSLATR